GLAPGRHPRSCPCPVRSSKPPSQDRRGQREKDVAQSSPDRPAANLVKFQRTRTVNIAVLTLVQPFGVVAAQKQHVHLVIQLKAAAVHIGTRSEEHTSE